MARVKNTVRAEARRRHRASQVAARTAAEQADAETNEEPAATLVTGPATGEGQGVTARPGLRLPALREDLAALPGMFRTRRLLWLPIVLMLLAFVGEALVLRGVVRDPGLERTVATFFSFVLLPAPGLLPVFIAGFLAPRASYLVGLVVGLIDGVLILLLVLLAGGGVTVEQVGTALVIGPLYAVGIGWFSSWYRDFLRRSSARRRVAQEARAKERRRAQSRPVRPTR